MASELSWAATALLLVALLLPLGLGDRVTGNQRIVYSLPLAGIVIGWLAAQNNTIFVARERRRGVTEQVDVLRSALREDPDERFQTASAMEEALDYVILQTARPPSLRSVRARPVTANKLQPPSRGGSAPLPAARPVTANQPERPVRAATGSAAAVARSTWASARSAPAAAGSRSDSGTASAGCRRRQSW